MGCISPSSKQAERRLFKSFYTIQSEELVKRFFDYKYYPRGSFGVALDKDVASTGNIHRFKDVGATVFVYTVARIARTYLA